MRRSNSVLGVRGGRWRWLLACVGGALAFSAFGGSASAAVDIGSPPGGPLTKVSVGADASCQDAHTGDSAFEFYPSSTDPGDCGTFLVVGGQLYAPDFASHGGTATGSLGSYTPWTQVSQTGKTGSGTSANPYKVVTVVKAGSTGLTVTQTDTYVSGQEAYRTDITIQNTSGAAQSVILYRAGDCYLQGSDSGFGFTGPNGAVGCSEHANNSPPGRIEEWVPISGGASFLEDGYSSVWAAIGAQTPFSNQCVQCTSNIDNGSGISWSVTIQPGQSVTLSHFTTFSPKGVAGPPQPPPPTSGDLAAAKTPRCLSISQVVRNRVVKVAARSLVLSTRQVDNPAQPLRLAVSLKGSPGIASVTFLVNGKQIPVTPGARRANVPVTLLKIGSKFRNKIVAIVVLTNGKTYVLTQFMVILKCHVPPASCKRLKGNKRLRCTSKSPLSGRRARVTVTRSRTETASGSAPVSKGRYTVIVVSRNLLGTGVYAFKAVITTGKPGERFQVIRLVTVT